MEMSSSILTLMAVDTVLSCFIIQFSIILPVRMVNIIGVLKF